jgi:hypothetical protein
MKIEEVFIGIGAALVIASICWLVREVLSIRGQLIKLQTQVNLQMRAIMKNCSRHQRWAEQLQKSLHRMDNNIVAICITQGIKHEVSTEDEDVSFNDGDCSLGEGDEE